MSAELLREFSSTSGHPRQAKLARFVDNMAVEGLGDLGGLPTDLAQGIGG
jgi:hypothetical protein